MSAHDPTRRQAQRSGGAVAATSAAVRLCVSEPVGGTLGTIADRSAPLPPSRPRARVLVTGLAPAAGWGLTTALRHGGLDATLVPSLAQLPRVLAAAADLLVVVGQDDGAATARLLTTARAGSRRPRLALLLGEDTPAAFAAGLRAGAVGLVAAAATMTEVVSVVRSAAAGFTVLPPEVVRALCAPPGAPGAGAAPAPDAREREWLRHLAAGMPVAALAERCAYSEREMYRQLSRCYRRLGASSRTEALLLAQRAGWLTS